MAILSSESPLFDHISGRLGDLVFRRRGDRVIVAARPHPSNRKPTEKQRAQRMNFARAQVYAKSALADPVTRAVYERVAKRDGRAAHLVATRDYCHAPVIDHIDLDAYRGQPGDAIVIWASDDTAVARVLVTVRTREGEAIEGGIATDLGGRWVYRATALVPSARIAVITVIAEDHPGNRTAQVRMVTAA